MAREYVDLSTTAGSNNAAAPNGWPENMAASDVNNTAREDQARTARWFKDNNGSLTLGGTSTAYTVTLNQGSLTAWAQGLSFVAKANATSGATPTINPTPTGGSALGAKSLYMPDGTQVTTGHIVNGGIYRFTYDGTNVQVEGLSAPTTTTLGAVPTSTTLTAGAGLTGGGDLSANRTFAVGAGTGITVNADDVAVTFAVQSDMETPSSTAVSVNPAVQHYHPAHPKVIGEATVSAGNPSLVSGVAYNVTSITDGGVGVLGVTQTTAHSSANAKTVIGMVAAATHGFNCLEDRASRAAGSFVLWNDNTGGSLADPSSWAWAAFGDL